MRAGAIVGVAKRDAPRGATDEVTIREVIRTWNDHEDGDLRSLCSVVQPPARSAFG